MHLLEMQNTNMLSVHNMCLIIIHAIITGKRTKGQGM